MTMMTSDLRTAREFLDGMSGGVQPTPVLCAVSGGLDSMCLLHLLTTYGRARNMAVTAAHFNHQLRDAESDRDEAFVRNWCAEHDVPLVCGRGDVRALAAEEKLSLEEAARTARYQFLAQQQRLGGYTFVLTAHHADDNAETLLLNLLRGTGLRGLSGIPEFRGCIARPFLQVTRQELAAYAAQNGIPHVEDSTNEEDEAARNVLRHKVLPVLRELNPRAVEHMSRTTELLAQDEQALSCAAGQLLRKAKLEERRAAVAAELLQDEERAIVSRCIWAMLCHVSGRQKDLGRLHVDAVYNLLRGGAEKEVSLPYGMRARKEKDTLVVWKTEPLPQARALMVGERLLFGNWFVELTEDGGRELALPEDAEVAVTLWRKEDRMTIAGERGPRSFKRLCADRGIPPAKRDQLPVLRVNGRPAAVPGIGIDLAFVPENADHITTYVRFQEKEENIYEK